MLKSVIATIRDATLPGCKNPGKYRRGGGGGGGRGGGGHVALVRLQMGGGDLSMKLLVSR